MTKNYRGGQEKAINSHKDHGRNKNLFFLQLFFMKLVGQMPINLETFGQKSGRRLAKCYCAFSAISTLHLALLFTKTTYDMLQTREIDEISDALTMAIIYSFATFATCYWFCRSRFLIDFLADINEQYAHHSVDGLTFVCATNSHDLAYKITLYWLGCCIMGVVSWALNPLLLGSYSLPLKCWYPFDPLRHVIYETTYASQVWCQFIMGCIFGNGSALFVSIIIVMLGQYDILYCSLKNLNYHTQLVAGENVNSLKKQQSELLNRNDKEINQYATSKEYLVNLNAFYQISRIQAKQSTQKLLRNSLIECVLLHQTILKNCHKLEDLFNPYCFIKSLQITLQLCLLVFVGVAGENSIIRVINLLQYLALTLSELFLFTYFGELLRTHSVRAGEAFFRSQWWPAAHSIKQDVLIFLVNTTRGVKLTAGKFYSMDIERLRSVVTQAFSFLTLLQKLAEKN